MERIGRLRLMEEADLETVLEWRNSDRIRNVMLNREPIEWEKHRRWFEGVKDNPNHHVLLYEYENRPVGLVQFYRFDRIHLTAYWGFYLGDTSVPKGSGKRMGESALHYFFTDLKMRKLCAEVLAFNETSISYHHRLGFVREGLLRKQVMHIDGFEDIAIFGLLAEEWGKRI